MDVKPPDKRTIFERALDFASGAEREAYLEDACAGKAEMRAQVDSLLKAHNDVGSFLDGPAFDAQRTASMEPISEQPGTIIGPYKLLEQIGEGGFGVVFMAEQEHPIRRRVAVKVIKPGMDTRQVIARFEAERQALALMDHPNIAHVLDAGATDSGRPYFVMELVRGVPITEFCDHHRIAVDERLKLFMAVCRAVQHAHQKGIIHRDLKPTNVLVTLHDGEPVAKVIDFGVAKATGQRLTDKTLFTAFAQMIGTPLYMSPEQTEMSGLDVDTRSDIYSLGVMLYELLTGTTPLDKERLQQAAYDEIRRIIREEEPPKPSTRISTLGATATAISTQRQSEPVKLSNLVRGELDWIVMKCLEKDRNRRFETASGLAADIERYLNDEQVLACPPSTAYRFRKFVRRHKAKLATASVVAVALLFAVGSLGWAMRDRTARHAKVAGQVELILSEIDQLQREQKWAEALPAARRADAVVIGGEADAATAQRVRQRLQDLEFLDRLEQIRMQRITLVDGKFDDAGADRNYARAFRDYGVDVGALAVETSIDRLKARPALVIPLAAALDDWVLVRRNVSEKDAARWKPLVAVARGIDAEPLRDRLRSTWGQSGSETEDELRRLAESINVRAQHPATLLSLARTLRGVKQSDSALLLLRNAQSVYPGDFWLNFELADALREQQDLEGAIRFYTAAVSIRPRSSAGLSNLGAALFFQKKLDEAVAASRKAIELDPKFAGAYSSLGLALAGQKKLDEAIAASRKAVEIDPKKAGFWVNLGETLRRQQKFDEAAAAYRKAIELDPKDGSPYGDIGSPPSYSPQVAAYKSLGKLLQDEMKLDEAVAVWRELIQRDPKLAGAHFGLGAALYDQKKLDEAVAAYRKAIELDPKYALAHINLGMALHDQKKLDEAIVAYRKAVELDPTPEVLDQLNVQAYFLRRDGDLEQARELRARVVECAKTLLPAEDARRVKYQNDYFQLLLAMQRYQEAETVAGDALKSLPSKETTSRLMMLRSLANLYQQWNKPEEADRYQKLVHSAEAEERASTTPTSEMRALDLNNRAWSLATSVDPQPRDTHTAVELAQEAVKLAPNTADFWNTLGVAQYRDGNFKDAISALQKYRDLRTSDAEYGNPFFLAMAHWQLGNKEEARRWYEIAVKWMDAAPSRSTETMKRFRHEAAEGLGVNESN